MGGQVQGLGPCGLQRVHPKCGGPERRCPPAGAGASASLERLPLALWCDEGGAELELRPFCRSRVMFNRPHTRSSGFWLYALIPRCSGTCRTASREERQRQIVPLEVAEVDGHRGRRPAPGPAEGGPPATPLADQPPEDPDARGGVPGAHAAARIPHRAAEGVDQPVAVAVVQGRPEDALAALLVGHALPPLLGLASVRSAPDSSVRTGSSRPWLCVTIAGPSDSARALCLPCSRSACRWPGEKPLRSALSCSSKSASARSRPAAKQAGRSLQRPVTVPGGCPASAAATTPDPLHPGGAAPSSARRGLGHPILQGAG
jgi:hypothetical protein